MKIPFSLLCGISMLLLLGCPEAGQQSASVADSDDSTEAAEVVTSETTDEVESLTESSDSMRTRGLAPASNARMANFSFEKQFPLLWNLVKSDAAMLAEIESFAAKVVNPGSLRTESELLQVFEERDELITHFQPFLENQDEDWMYQNWQSLEAELNQIGLSMQSAEGMFIGLGKSELLPGAVADIGSDALKWYLKFIYARDESQNGEYPFMDMSPYPDMLEAGEKLRALQPNPYYSKIEEDFHQAIISMADIHSVSSPEGRGNVFVFETNTEYYPFATEVETRQQFAAQRSEDSPYPGVMRKILNNMSEMSERPEHLFVIVTEWVDDAAMARSRVSELLMDGYDIPHRLEIRRPNGTDQYAISYRFYEDGEKADAALELIQKDFPDAELFMVSVRGNKLYQMESAMN